MYLIKYNTIFKIILCYPISKRIYSTIIKKHQKVTQLITFSFNHFKLLFKKKKTLFLKHALNIYIQGMQVKN